MTRCPKCKGFWGRCADCLRWLFFSLVHEIIKKRLEDENWSSIEIREKCNEDIKEMLQMRTIICCTKQQCITMAHAQSKKIGAERTGDSPVWKPGPPIEIRRDGSRCDFCEPTPQAKRARLMVDSIMEYYSPDELEALFSSPLPMCDRTAKTAPGAGQLNPANTCVADVAPRASGRLYNFSEALGLLKDGVAVARRGWHGRNMFIKIERPNVYGHINLPFIYISMPPAGIDFPGKRDRCPWLASQTDILAEDWYIVSPE